jgi:outer membrane protein OmpA-like peptidoglycan-associated protein
LYRYNRRNTMKAFARIAMICAILPAMAIAGDLFPGNPVPMTEGYGKDGAGLHFAQPSGLPGSDCVVNPVSFKWHEKSVVETETVEVETLVPGDVISIPAKVLFNFDKDFLRPEGKAALDELAAKFKETGLKSALIVGNTDSMGTDEYNMALGQRRADAVREYLQAALPGVELKAVSDGESKPLVPNTFPDGRDDPAGRQQNRRVDLQVIEVDRLVKSEEQVVTVTKVLAERNPQVFHVLSSGNQVYCGADQHPGLGFGLFWSGGSNWRGGSRW